MIKVSRLLTLHEEDLNFDDLWNRQRQFEKLNGGIYSDGNLMIVRSDLNKEFAFYISFQIEDGLKKKTNDKQLGFYWINGDQLVTVTN